MRNHDMVIIESIIAKANKKIFSACEAGQLISVNGVEIQTSPDSDLNYVSIEMNPLFDYCGTMQMSLVVNCIIDNNNNKYDLDIVDITSHINDIMFKKFEIYISRIEVKVLD